MRLTLAFTGGSKINRVENYLPLFKRKKLLDSNIIGFHNVPLNSCYSTRAANNLLTADLPIFENIFAQKIRSFGSEVYMI